MQLVYLLCLFTLLFHVVKFFVNFLCLELLGIFEELTHKMTRDVEMTEDFEIDDGYDYKKIDILFNKYSNCEFF